MLAVSSLAPGTLAELAAAFAGADRHRHILHFAPADTLAGACAAAGLVAPRIEQRRLRLYYRNMAALLRELKALGANQIGGPRRPGLMGRQTWQAVEARYEAHRDADGLPATFEVVLCTAHKPTS
jgi:malonyl-CoA O-methyltransferase